MGQYVGQSADWAKDWPGKSKSPILARAMRKQKCGPICGPIHNGFLLETSPVLQNGALEDNSLEEEEKVHPKLKELRRPW